MGGQEVCQTGAFLGCASVRDEEGFRMGKVMLYDAMFGPFCWVFFCVGAVGLWDERAVAFV